MSRSTRSMRELKGLFDRGTNIMQHLRDAGETDENTDRSVLVAYDLQAGSYVKELNLPRTLEYKVETTAAMARIFDELGCDSILEAGVGEATTLTHVVKQLSRPPRHVYGFDLSWSRIRHGRRYAGELGLDGVVLFTGNLFRVPLVSDCIDVVYTHHSIEPNRGREGEAIGELYRVARRYLVLLEPTYELGNRQTRRNIERHRYCTNLHRAALDLGLKVQQHRLFDFGAEHNQRALIVIEKEPDASPVPPRLACPCCRVPVLPHGGHLYCRECFQVYPVVGGIPCLQAEHGILAGSYLDD